MNRRSFFGRTVGFLAAAVGIGTAARAHAKAAPTAVGRWHRSTMIQDYDIDKDCNTWRIVRFVGEYGDTPPLLPRPDSYDGEVLQRIFISGPKAVSLPGGIGYVQRVEAKWEFKVISVRVRVDGT